MTQLQVTQYSSAQFTHDAAKKTLVAEASDIGFMDFEQLYDDACDVGLALVNPNTGNVTHWHLAEEHTREGDITHWTLKPTWESIYRTPSCDGYTMTIFND